MLMIIDCNIFWVSSRTSPYLALYNVRCTLWRQASKRKMPNYYHYYHYYYHETFMHCRICLFIIQISWSIHHSRSLVIRCCCWCWCCVRCTLYAVRHILSGTELNIKIWVTFLALSKGHIHIAQTFLSDNSRDWKKKILRGFHHISHTSLMLIHAYKLVGSISPAHDRQLFLLLLQSCSYKSPVGLGCLLFCLFHVGTTMLRDACVRWS